MRLWTNHKKMIMSQMRLTYRVQQRKLEPSRTRKHVRMLQDHRKNVLDRLVHQILMLLVIIDDIGVIAAMIHVEFEIMNIIAMIEKNGHYVHGGSKNK